MAVYERDFGFMIVEDEDDYSEGSDMSSDSDADPSYNILEEVNANFSNLSLKKKSKSRLTKDDEKVEEEGVVVDKKSFEEVQKIIEGGKLEKLKVEQCKVYLRKYGLRLTGNKETLIQRINEHQAILNGSGEEKYPISSFVLNCKGDACTGDVVMFEQNVYEMFSIASRSATGPPCGTRIVAGRIVKESYGAAKQQHTFTIEVLWSKGEKPLPPLHPLLIKGRNLYRMKTLRQRWKDEAERQKVLKDKHSRGSLARSERDMRNKRKEMRKAPKTDSFCSHKNGVQKSHSHSTSTSTANSVIPSHESGKSVTETRQHRVQTLPDYSNYDSSHAKTYSNIDFMSAPFERDYYNRQPLKNVNNHQPTSSQHRPVSPQYSRPMIPLQRQHQSHQWPTNPPHCWPVNPPMVRRQGQSQQVCRHYARGMCHFGDNCKFLHEQHRDIGGHSRMVQSSYGSREFDNF